MSIRRAGPEDVEVLVLLNRHVHTLHVDALPDRYRPVDDDAVRAWFQQQIARVDVWILRAGDEDVGYCVTEVNERPESPFALPSRTLVVDQLAVDARHRGRGHGRSLMAHAEALAVERGCDGIELDVLDFNAGARAFYAALGYRPLKHRMRRGLHG